MAKYRKRPVVVEAVRAAFVLDDVCQSLRNSPDWIVRAYSDGLIGFGLDTVIVNTREGRMHAERSDWILQGVQGELYPCKPGIFAATFEAVEDTPVGGDPDYMCPNCVTPWKVQRPASQRGGPMTDELRMALRNLRYLYEQMLVPGQVQDTASAARGLLGPAIERLERLECPFASVAGERGYHYARVELRDRSGRWVTAHEFNFSYPFELRLASDRPEER